MSEMLLFIAIILNFDIVINLFTCVYAFKLTFLVYPIDQMSLDLIKMLRAQYDR